MTDKDLSLEATLGWSGTDSWSWLRDVPPDEELGGGAILVWRDVAAARAVTR